MEDIYKAPKSEDANISDTLKKDKTILIVSSLASSWIVLVVACAIVGREGMNPLLNGVIVLALNAIGIFYGVIASLRNFKGMNKVKGSFAIISTILNIACFLLLFVSSIISYYSYLGS